ncbi:MAG: hypothetical protein AAF674_02090 [Pseudomonadota bacterium]
MVLGALFVALGVATATAAQCAQNPRTGACVIKSGEYFIRLPERIAGPERTPIVMMLHDAGRDGTDLINDQVLIDRLLGRGYAVIVPVAGKRKYVRVTTEGPLDGKFTSLGRISKSDRRYPMQRRDGTVVHLKQAQDRGWYFYDTDVHTRRDPLARHEEIVTQRLGRDETAFLRTVIRDASLTFWLDADDVTLIGFGHGAALAWQVACHDPDFAVFVAPVNGTIWGSVAPNCKVGAKILHTHERGSALWPLDGQEETRRQFGQFPVRQSIEHLAKANGCTLGQNAGTPGTEHQAWQNCLQLASVELALLDTPFDFPDWWFQAVLDRSDTGNPAGSAAANASPLATPRFLKPKYPSAE